MARCVLRDFECGFLLGPFPKSTRFLQLPENSSPKQLRFVNVFTVLKAKRNQSVGWAVFDLKKSGYNAEIPDDDAFVILPSFNEIINLLRNKSYACILDLFNVYRK